MRNSIMTVETDGKLIVDIESEYIIQNSDGDDLDFAFSIFNTSEFKNEREEIKNQLIELINNNCPDGVIYMWRVEDGTWSDFNLLGYDTIDEVLDDLEDFMITTELENVA